jgi:hypothetical protein
MWPVWILRRGRRGSMTCSPGWRGVLVGWSRGARPVRRRTWFCPPRPGHRRRHVMYASRLAAAARHRLQLVGARVPRSLVGPYRRHKPGPPSARNGWKPTLTPGSSSGATAASPSRPAGTEPPGSPSLSRAATLIATTPGDEEQSMRRARQALSIVAAVAVVLSSASCSEPEQLEPEPHDGTACGVRECGDCS